MSLEWWGERDAQELVPCRLPCCGRIVHLAAPKVSEFQCSSCEACPLKRGPASRDYVPSAALEWTGASCNKSRLLEAPSGDKAATIEDLAGTLASPPSRHLDLGESRLRTQCRPDPGNAFLVWRASTAGCIVDGGTVELPQRGVLLLAGRGVHFHGTTFKGGAVMCAGADFTGTFESCTFQTTAVYAVHAAAVTLRSCIIHSTHPGLTLSGDATHATLIDCLFHACHTSIIVDAGATARARDCTLLSTACAVTVRGRGSHAGLDGCAAFGMHDESIGKTGVAACGGTASLRDCHLATFYTAVSARLRTTAIEVHGLEVSSVVRGVVCTTRAHALVRDCDFRLTREGRCTTVALLAGGAAGDAAPDAGGACMQIERSEVHHSAAKARGLAVDDGSAVSASLCRFNCSCDSVTIGGNEARAGGSAVLADCTVTSPHISLVVWSPGTRVRLVGGCYEGSSTACGVNDGAKLAAIGCEFRSRGVQDSVGVLCIAGEAHAWLHRCHVHDGVAGVCVLGGSAVCTDTSVNDMHVLFKLYDLPGRCNHEPCMYKGGAAYGCTHGRLTVRRGSVRRCVMGIDANDGAGGGAEAAVSLDGVTFTDCAAGADFGNGATATVARCEFQGLEGERRGGPDLAALRKASKKMFCCFADTGIALSSPRVTVEHCTLEGFSVGVQPWAEDDGATIRHCTVKATSDGGTCVRVRGPVALEDCTFAGVPGRPVEELQTFGVHAVEGAACTIRRCRFNALSGDAIDAEGQSSVTVVGSSVAGGSSRGFVVLGDAELAAQDCSISDVYTAVGVHNCGGKFTAKRVTLHADRMNIHLPSVREQDGRRTVVKLVDSVLRGGTTSVCIADAFSDLAFIRCEISDCDTGIVLGGPLNARMKGTRISRCKTGVSVGDVMMFEEDPCPVCGEFGQQAIQVAYQSLFGSGGRPAREGRCVHEGAVARLSMVDSELVECRQLGVRVNLHGRLDAEGVTARRCGTAFFMEYLNERSKFVRCKAVGCAVATKGAQQREVRGRMLPVDMLISEVEELPGEGG